MAYVHIVGTGVLVRVYFLQVYEVARQFTKNISIRYVRIRCARARITTRYYEQIMPIKKKSFYDCRVNDAQGTHYE